ARRAGLRRAPRGAGVGDEPHDPNRARACGAKLDAVVVDSRFLRRCQRHRDALGFVSRAGARPTAGSPGPRRSRREGDAGRSARREYLFARPSGRDAERTARGHLNIVQSRLNAPRSRPLRQEAKHSTADPGATNKETVLPPGASESPTEMGGRCIGPAARRRMKMARQVPNHDRPAGSRRAPAKVIFYSGVIAMTITIAALGAGCRLETSGLGPGIVTGSEQPNAYSCGCDCTLLNGLGGGP